MILYSCSKKHIVFNSYYWIPNMSSKKQEKTEDKKDTSAMNEIKKIETKIKELSSSLNKLKTKFKPKGEATK